MAFFKLNHKWKIHFWTQPDHHASGLRMEFIKEIKQIM